MIGTSNYQRYQRELKSFQAGVDERITTMQRFANRPVEYITVNKPQGAPAMESLQRFNVGGTVNPTVNIFKEPVGSMIDIRI